MYNAALINSSSITLLAQLIQIYSFPSKSINKAHVLIKNQPESIMINKATDNSHKLQTQNFLLISTQQLHNNTII